MSDVNKSKGFTKLPTEILVALCRIRIRGEANQILNVVIRKTYGFHKKEDWITLSQFMLLTNLPKSSVIRGRNILVEMNIISVRKNGNRTYYKVNSDIHTWQPSEKIPRGNKKVNANSQNSNSDGSYFVPHNR